MDEFSPEPLDGENDDPNLIVSENENLNLIGLILKNTDIKNKMENVNNWWEKVGNTIGNVGNVLWGDQTQEAKQGERDNLGLIGNAIKKNSWLSGLDTPLEKDLFEHFWKSSAKDYVLNNDDWTKMINSPEVKNEMDDLLVGGDKRYWDIDENNNDLQKAYDKGYFARDENNNPINTPLIIDYRDNPNYDTGFGEGYFEIDKNKNFLGFYDYYDFDPKPPGERSKWDERKTRAVNWANKIGLIKGKDFNITTKDFNITTAVDNYDYYDFDSKPFGERSWWGEVKTRLQHLMNP